MKKERKPARVLNGQLFRTGPRQQRWWLLLACGHKVYRAASGAYPKLPRRVRSCEKCEMAARLQGAK